eukprot:scaffold112663_cov36-Attheya_sp.AAC.2
MTAGVAFPANAVWRGNRPPSESILIPLGYASKRAFKSRKEASSRSCASRAAPLGERGDFRKALAFFRANCKGLVRTGDAGACSVVAASALDAV